MSEKRKKMYEAPQLTAVSFKTERGYANSVDLLKTLAIISATSYGTGDQNLEDRGTATSWTW